MSLTPTTPNLGSLKDRAFWTKAESIPAWGIVLAAVGAIGYGWGMIVPFILAMVANTLELFALVAIGFAVIYLLFFSERFRMAYRVLCRWLMSQFVNIFPIQILEERLSKMKDRRDVMKEQIKSVSGQVRYLKDIILKNKETANQQLKQAAYARDSAQKAQDEAEQRRMALQMKVKANKAGRLENANLSYQQLLNKLQAIYNLLAKWADHIDAYIEDTEDEVAQKKIEYKVINTAYGAYTSAMAVLKGNKTEEETYDMAMEMLAENAGRKLGEMEDFQRVAQGFMDSLDIQNGVVTQEALAKLDEYEQKLLTSGSADTAFLLPGATAQPVPVFRQGVSAVKPQSAGSDYDNLFQ